MRIFGTQFLCDSAGRCSAIRKKRICERKKQQPDETKFSPRAYMPTLHRTIGFTQNAFNQQIIKSITSHTVLPQ